MGIPTRNFCDKPQAHLMSYSVASQVVDEVMAMVVSNE